MKKFILVVAALATLAVSAPTIASAQGVDVRIAGDREINRDRGEFRGDRDRGEIRGDRDRGDRDRGEIRGDRDRREMRGSRDEYRDRDRGFHRERHRDRVIVIKRRYRRH
jgi:hypothetical protein